MPGREPDGNNPWGRAVFLQGNGLFQFRHWEHYLSLAWRSRSLNSCHPPILPAGGWRWGVVAYSHISWYLLQRRQGLRSRRDEMWGFGGWRLGRYKWEEGTFDKGVKVSSALGSQWPERKEKKDVVGVGGWGAHPSSAPCALLAPSCSMGEQRGVSVQRWQTMGVLTADLAGPGKVTDWDRLQGTCTN